MAGILDYDDEYRKKEKRCRVRTALDREDRASIERERAWVCITIVFTASLRH